MKKQNWNVTIHTSKLQVLQTKPVISKLAGKVVEFIGWKNKCKS